MEFVMDIFYNVLPLALMGAVVVFVIKRLEHKFKQGTLAKKKTKKAQRLLDSLIPLGMIAGCNVGIIISLIFNISLLSTISFGAGIGYLVGYFAYEIYGNKQESP
ncbi:hypothetical protein [Shouchella patagoniensis]|uniref:hypothetical protein n=1 Tax=Shouchella patagoniensis TaxID=228576 RepID=UPI0011174B17|nr:hypothetical protein [Shouchella patagoniensis]